MASFQQTLRRFLRANATLAAAPAMALAALSPSARLEAAPEPQVATASAAAPVEFVGVFLAKESAQQLVQRFPTKFATAADETLYLVLKYNPSEQEKEAFAPLLGADAQIRVKGYAEDETTQAVRLGCHACCSVEPALSPSFVLHPNELTDWLTD